MVLYRFILAASCLVSNVGAFSPVTSVTKNAPVIQSQVEAFNFPNFFGGNDNSGDKSKKTNVIAGASGYIGKSTVRESVRQGYNTIALVRDLSKVESPQGQALYGQFFEGAKIVECDVCDPVELTKVSNILYRVYFGALSRPQSVRHSHSIRIPSNDIIDYG